MSQHSHSTRCVAVWRALTFLSAALILAACGDDPYPTPPPGPTTTVTGRVTNSADHNPIAGAAVRIGNAVDTTGADGGFELTGVVPGSVTLRCTAPGYEDFEIGIIATANPATQDIALTRETRFDGDRFALHVPANVDTIRALVLLLGVGDTRGFTMTSPPGPTSPLLLGLGQLLRNLALTHGLAIMGTSLGAMSNDTGSDEILLDAIDAAASSSRHPELATAP